MKKILVIQTAFIGDVILMTSLLETLHSAYGNTCQIDVVVRKGNEVFFKEHPFVKRCLVWAKKEGKYKALFNVIREVRKETYDTVYNVQRFASAGFITLRSRAKNKVGFKKNPFAFCYTRKVAHQIGDGSHETERNFKLIQPDLPANQQLCLPKLYPTRADKERVAAIIENTPNFYVFAPASVWFTKQLPKEKWIELGKQASNETLLFIGAPSDAALIDEIRKELTTQKTVNLAGKLSLVQSALLMQKALRTFVNDSAPLHLASAVNAPVTAFFCSTVPTFGFGPLSADAKIAETPEKLSCRPCGLHGHKACPKGHFKCGYQIQPKLA